MFPTVECRLRSEQHQPAHLFADPAEIDTSWLRCTPAVDTDLTLSDYQLFLSIQNYINRKNSGSL